MTAKLGVAWTLVIGLAVAAYGGPPALPAEYEWSNPLEYQGKLDSPLVEVTPFVFKGRYYRLDNWQKQWDYPDERDGSRFTEDEIRIVDMETGEIVSIPLIGHGLGMAFVDGDRVYVFGSYWGEDKKWNVNEITMVSSTDLKNWTEPVMVLRANEDERFFNVSVCKGAADYIMLVESNDPRWPAFTFKYFRSDDLVHWEQIPDAIYGREKYVGGPALYYEGGKYYTLYLESLGNRFWETRVTRSEDLVHWEDAPEDRPFVTFNPENKVHPFMPADARERNASDAEICFWDGQTIMYFTGGVQKYAGDLQWSTYDGTPRELLEHFYDEPALPKPTAAQLRYQNQQLGAFVHFGLASYTGDGGDYRSTPDAALFNPVDLDTDQWMEAAKAFGAEHIVLTAKHHNGFCLWPTETTDYSVESAPWQDGQGDVVRAFVDAARKHGLRPGLYISSGDTHFGCEATPEPRGVRKIVGDVDAYFPVFMKQLEELLTNYGELDVVWFDGAYNPFDPDVLDANGEPVGQRYAGPITERVRALQPNAVIMGAGDPDIRWAGSEQGLAPYPLWDVVHEGEGNELYLPPNFTGWCIPEVNIHTRKHWFWAPDTDGTLKAPGDLVAAYDTSIGRGANLLVNMTPDRSGLVPAMETAMLQAFGEAIAARYDEPLAELKDDVPVGEGRTFTLHFEAPTRVNQVVMEEAIDEGQRIKGYRIEAIRDGKWIPIAEGTSIGRKRIAAFETVETASVRVKIMEGVPVPKLCRLAAYMTE